MTDLGERRTTSEQAGPISDRSVVPWNLRLALGRSQCCFTSFSSVLVSAASSIRSCGFASSGTSTATRSTRRRSSWRSSCSASASAATCFGVLADRRYQSRPESLVHLYGVLELLIAGFGLVVSLVPSASRRHRCAPVLLRDRFGGVAGAHIRVTSGSRCDGRRAAGTYDGADGWDVDRVGSRGRAIGSAVVGLARRAALRRQYSRRCDRRVSDRLRVGAGSRTDGHAVRCRRAESDCCGRRVRNRARRVCVAACAATTDHHDDGLAGRALGGPCAGVVGVRCARHGNRLVATSCRVARRLPRGLLASSHRDARRPGRGSVAGRMARSPIRAARTNADDRSKHSLR